jgi:fructokinase
MLDPNCRPSATPDPGAFRARIDRIVRRADIVKASDDDLRFLAPDDPLDATVERLLGLGARVVLRTHGADDVQVRTRSGHASVPVPPVEVVDTVGAGDAFGGGFLASWTAAGRERDGLASMDLVCASVRMAVRVAALSCSRPGADPPTLAELAAFPG